MWWNCSFDPVGAIHDRPNNHKKEKRLFDSLPVWLSKVVGGGSAALTYNAVSRRKERTIVRSFLYFCTSLWLYKVMNILYNIFVRQCFHFASFHQFLREGTV